jgi:cell division protein FtsB
MHAVGRLLVVLLPSLVIAAALFSVPAMVFGARGLPRLRALEGRLAQIEEENAERRRENELLVRHIEALREDPRQVEWAARRDLGLVMPDELVFQF